MKETLKYIVAAQFVLCSFIMSAQDGIHIGGGVGFSTMNIYFDGKDIDLTGISMSIEAFYKIDRSELGIEIQKQGRIRNDLDQNFQWGSLQDVHFIVYEDPFFQQVSSILHHSFLISYQYEWLKKEKFSISSGMSLGLITGQHNSTFIRSEGDFELPTVGFKKSTYRKELTNNFQIKALYHLNDKSSIGTKLFYGRPLEFFNAQVYIQTKL